MHEFLSDPDQDNQESGIDYNFAELTTTAIAVLNPSRDKVLLEWRRDVNKLAIISGRGALNEFRSTPDYAAEREVEWDTGLAAEVQRVCVCIQGRDRVGLWTAILDEAVATSHPEGHGKERQWVDLKAAAQMDLAFNQQAQLQIFIELFSL